MGEFILIPFSVIKPLLEGQIGYEEDVTRRSFVQFLKDARGIERADHGRPSLMSRLIRFEKEDNAIKVVKKGDINKIITYTNKH